MLSGVGHENAQLHCGTIFQDAATGISWVECQVFLGAGKTIMVKILFE